MHLLRRTPRLSLQPLGACCLLISIVGGWLVWETVTSPQEAVEQRAASDCLPPSVAWVIEPQDAAANVNPSHLNSPQPVASANAAPQHASQSALNGSVRPATFDGPVLIGIDSQLHQGPGEPHWKHSQPIPWQAFAQGEYIGPHRTPHVPEYRLRPDDVLEIVYRLTRVKSSEDYRFEVGDALSIDSVTDPRLNRDVQTVMPDGTISLPLVGRVQVANRTIEELQNTLEERYREFDNEPSLTITPTKIATRLEDLRATVDARFGNGGQFRLVTVTPEGTIALPAIGSVYVNGLTLDEVTDEINARYREIPGIGNGIEVTPTLTTRAQRFVFVFGEVNAPGRFVLTGPTTVIMALALSEGFINGANLREVVVLRRAEDWRLVATKLDLRGALLGKRPAPADDLWLRDSDIVIVPKGPLRLSDDLIELVFTQGANQVFAGVADAFTVFNVNTTMTMP